MPGTIPTQIMLYRMLHIDNVEHVLTHGICAKGHPDTDPHYINIGDTSLIANRNEYSVKVIPPGGTLGQYVPFYFGPHSPMLLKIRDGNGGITRRPQSDIVYLLCYMADVTAACPEWCFTDGHAKNEITEFYNHPDNLGEIDWQMVSEKYWSNNEDDYDRMRRKQAEFLVKHHVPVGCIYGIATYSIAAKNTVEIITTKLRLNIPRKGKKQFILLMKFVTGNLMDADVQALVNTVNTVGVMGKGIALQFKNEFPENNRLYVAACKTGELQPGKLLVVREHKMNGERIIINFPTKTEWYQKSKYEYIEAGLQELVNVIDRYGIKSIAIPPLGCGNGGLKWEKVRPMMEHYLGPLKNIDIQIYEPNDAVKALLKQQETDKKVKLTKARSMLLYAMFYYESLGENSSLFVANKLAYFLQRLGEKEFNRLKFEGHHYGPYSVGVAHLLHNLNGKYIKGLEQMDAKAFEVLELQYDTVPEVSEYVRKELSPEQRQRLSSLVKLIDGFQSALSLEVLATVDFIKKENPGISPDEVTNKIHSWSARKRRLFQDRYIQKASARLEGYSNKLEIR